MCYLQNVSPIFGVFKYIFRNFSFNVTNVLGYMENIASEDIEKKFGKAKN
jgi:hypothetical protein